MCPSYLATRDEKDSTRGRARVLQEMVNGSLVTDGWRSDEVHEALDLCLSCKGCASDCPTGIDMATYKAEALHQRYRRRLRPAQPLRARPAAALGAADRAGGAARQPRCCGSARCSGSPRRRPASTSAGRCRRSRRARCAAAARRSTRAGPTGPGRGGVGRLVHRPLRRRQRPGARCRCWRRAGLRVGVVTEPACCGADLDQHRPARRGPADPGAAPSTCCTRTSRAGSRCVGLEPSCLATLRSDAVRAARRPAGRRGRGRRRTRWPSCSAGVAGLAARRT